jgi:hypothetical protein
MLGYSLFDTTIPAQYAGLRTDLFIGGVWRPATGNRARTHGMRGFGR